ncbi:MAG: transketolase, partial [Actinobacteria bacterium]|nr:transketolase [Actinomycetota bacterium]
VIIGDGECNEGQIWEAALAGAHHSLGNLCAFLDFNRFQNDGRTGDILKTEPLAEKWVAFGWHVLQIDGHDYDNILDALEEAKSTGDKPTMIIAETIKGKGTTYSEANHYNPPTPEQFEMVMKELEDTDNSN